MASVHVWISSAAGRGAATCCACSLRSMLALTVLGAAQEAASLRDELLRLQDNQQASQASD